MARGIRNIGKTKEGEKEEGREEKKRIKKDLIIPACLSN